MEIKSIRFSRTYNLNKAELIGQGNFAKVYKIYDEGMKKHIAIRQVLKSQLDMEDIVKEKQINMELQKVNNPHILEIYDIIDGSDSVWYITEYCSGGSLWDALNDVKNHKFSEIETLKCILQITKGVQELHSHRITHRDLKPENILLTKKYSRGSPLPQLKVADFGLSTNSIIMETVAGTKEYIAPEQAKFHTYTNAVDVWSIGIIFDELLHGEPYFTGQDNKDVFNKILKEQYRVRDERISQSIKTLLVSILKKKAYERPTIGMLKSKIQQILQDLEQPKSRQTLAAPYKSPRPISCQQLKSPTEFQNSLQPLTNQNTVTPFGSCEDITNRSSVSRQKSIDMHNEPFVKKHYHGKQNGIPIYNLDRKKAYPQIAKKCKYAGCSKSFIDMDQLYKTIQTELESFKATRIVVSDLTFNPNSKITPFETTISPFDRFVELRRNFDYLNEISTEEGYEIRLLQTGSNIDRCRQQLKKQIQNSKKELKNIFLEHIDTYIDELVAKNIS